MLGRRHTAWAILAIALAAFILVATVLTVDARAALRESSAEQAFAAALNRVRAAHGLPRLQIEPALVDSARAHSDEMVATDTFEHGSAWWRRLVRAGATGTHVGENIGWCADSVCPSGAPATLVGEWLASPDHRANILDPRFSHVGVGIAVGPFHGWDSAYVVTTDFDG
ncbi:MAG TPA: CAP domain-containing protein [Gaiellaceae bacterium]|nr:CAP domain-containing protein [Gaiellaceae bacterium]